MKAKDYERGLIKIYCPGCRGYHYIDAVRWKFNGNYDVPTFSPSIKITWNTPDAQCCHFYIKDGKILYQSDCTHDLKGTTVMLPDL